MLRDILSAVCHAALSYAKPCGNNIRIFKEKTDGFIKGVCHPDDADIHGPAEANIRWVRFDINARPLDENGIETAGYTAFKERALMYRSAGYRVMAVTPFPRNYSDAPFSPSDPEYRKKLSDDIVYIARDLQNIVSAFQIANEMQVEHFRHPLTEAQSIEFLGIQLQALENAKGNILVGFNLQDYTMVSYLRKMRQYIRYCDYIGLDLYLGCFESFTKEIFIYNMVLRFVWNYTSKPVVLNEFGYMSNGAPKSYSAKLNILRGYGYESVEAARADIRGFIGKLPARFSEHIINYTEYSSDEELASKLFDTELSNHLYCELPQGVKLKKYEHTPEGQAQFMKDAIARFIRLPFVCGAFVYCWRDSNSCFICGQVQCPVETAWGLIDVNGNKKPAWYSVRDAFR